jgi:hypothetical protein
LLRDMSSKVQFEIDHVEGTLEYGTITP